MIWQKSNRADPRCLPLADRHYNRQKIGSPSGAFRGPHMSCTLPIPWAIAWRFTGAPEAANDEEFS